MEDLKEIIPQALSEDQRRILELIGPEAYAKLVEVYGGMTIYIQKRDSFVRAARNEDIRRRFDGSNYKRLAQEHNLSEVAVRQIVADIDQKMRQPSSDQERWF
jgi:Mor family transcriptional regulator